MNTNHTTQTTPSGAPKLSRYLKRIEAKRQRRLNPHPRTKAAHKRNAGMHADRMTRIYAMDAESFTASNGVVSQGQQVTI